MISLIYTNYKKKAVYLRRIEKSKKETPVLIYQMGKVGSQSVFHALDKINGLHVFPVHNLEPTRLLERENYLGCRTNEDVLLGNLLNKHLIGQQLKKIKIITLIRDPIERNISAYFDNLDAIWKIKKAYLKISVGNLIERFLTFFEHAWPLVWFDLEFKYQTGIDVYQHSFSHQLGYQLLENDNYQVLLMKCTLADKKKKKLLSGFLQQNVPDLNKNNSAADKEYNKIYRDFYGQITFPSTMIENIYHSKFYSHFFSLEELSFAKKTFKVGVDSLSAVALDRY